jgi:molecular chaperone IbpA
MLDSALSADGSGSSYPPYNIEKIKEDVYRITMAVAGFRREDLNVILQDSVLIISGKADLKDNSVEYLHRGIAGRAFERHFQLADFIKVVGAAMDHGLLKINLEREVPESMKPRKINIEDEENKNRLIEQ